MTNEHLESLRSAVEDIVEPFMPTRSGPATFDAQAWATLDALGFTSLTLREGLGGSGGSLEDASVVLGAAALLDIPLADALFVAAPMLEAGSLSWPGGVVTASEAGGLELSQGSDGAFLSGRVSGVPWACDADHVVLLGQVPEPWVAVVATNDAAHGVTVVPDRRVDRGTLILDRAQPVSWSSLAPRPWADVILRRRAAGTVVQIASAARQALAMSIEHVRVREQFGRALSEFQVIQHMVAELAECCAVVDECARSAVSACDSDDPGDVLVLASAKAEASSAVHRICGLAHQLHGAMGFTAEHALGARTKRLNLWRDQAGNERFWATRIASIVGDAGGDPWAIVAPLEVGRAAVGTVV